MTNNRQQIVIIGAGHAGGNVSTNLRKNGYEGKITLIGNEDHIPYQRPPLSKAYLKTDMAEKKLNLRSEASYSDKDIELRLNDPVIALDKAAHEITLSSGARLSYDKLILATGSKTRRLTCPGSDLGGIHILRSLADAKNIKAALEKTKQLIIIGGGYIGLEIAASARSLGISVVLLEREERILNRVASIELSDFFTSYHREQGVDIRTSANVEALHGDETGRVRRVELGDGTTIEGDTVIVGIGATAGDELAEDAGLECNNGVVVDENARTSDPDIYAIGDITLRPLPHYNNRHIRLESVPNAIEQAKQAAADITGLPAPKAELPWFWSDQYKLKLQIAGIMFDIDRTVLVGSYDEGKFALYHFSGKTLMAIEAVSALKAFMAAKKVVATTDLDPDSLEGMAL